MRSGLHDGWRPPRIARRDREKPAKASARPTGSARALLASLALALPPAGAPAREAAPAGGVGSGCFARTYDAAHLARQPRQQVTAMRVSVADETIPGSVGVPPQTFVRLELTRRSDPRPLRAIGTCSFGRVANRTVDGRPVIDTYPRPDGTICVLAGEGLDAEGGEVLLSRTGATLTVHVGESVTVRRGSTVSADPGEWIELGRADRVFRLAEADNGACRALDRAIGFR